MTRHSQLSVTWVGAGLRGLQSAGCAGRGLGCGAPGAARSVGLGWLTMRGGQDEARAPVLQFTNCRILRGRALLRWGPGPVGRGTGSCSGVGRGTGSCSGAGPAAAEVRPRAGGARGRELLRSAYGTGSCLGAGPGAARVRGGRGVLAG